MELSIWCWWIWVDLILEPWCWLSESETAWIYKTHQVPWILNIKKVISKNQDFFSVCIQKTLPTGLKVSNINRNFLLIIPDNFFMFSIQNNWLSLINWPFRIYTKQVHTYIHSRPQWIYTIGPSSKRVETRRNASEWVEIDHNPLQTHQTFNEIASQWVRNTRFLLLNVTQLAKERSEIFFWWANCSFY